MKQKFLLALIFAGIFFGASCLKKTNLQVEDLGAAVSADSVAAALGDGFGQIDYNNIKLHEYSSIVLTQKLQDGVPQNLEQQDVTVKKINNQAAYLLISSSATITTYSGGTSSSTTRDWDQYFQKYSGFAFSMSQDAHAAAGTNTSEPLFMFQIIQNLALGSCYDGGSYPETCHNLTVTEVDWRVPPAASQPASCKDVFNCTIKAKKVEFDLIRKYELESDGKPKRIHYTLLLNFKDVPFTSRVLQYCTRSLYDVQGVSQKILADLCYNVNNYSFGN